jgi:hypothetical protein
MPDMPPLDPFARASFPDGSSFEIRTEYSGVVYDERNVVVDAELALTLLLIKARKFHQGPSLGRC